MRILNSFDELYALLMLLVERHYLLTYGGSFTENFYGLKRERVLRIKGGEVPRALSATSALVRQTLKLRTTDVWKNLAVMVALPYVKRKLDESYDIHVPQTTLLGPNYNRDRRLPPDASLKQRVMHYYKWFLRHIYPSVNAAYYFSLLAFNLAYLFDGSKYHSPFLWLIGTRMRRLGEVDQAAIALATQPKAPPTTSRGARPGETNSAFSPRLLLTTVYPRLLSSLRILLPTSIFALKFLEWWHASDFARQLSRKASEGLDLPPPVVSGLDQHPSPSPSSFPPTGKQSSPSGTQPSQPPPRKRKPAPIDATSLRPILTVPAPTPATSALCPICLNAVVTPTAAQTGYVFCYTCIHRWVEGTHERQAAFMEGSMEGWGEDKEEMDEDEDGDGEEGGKGHAKKMASREGKWENGKGRCAVTGRRVLGGTEGLRRVMV